MMKQLIKKSHIRKLVDHRLTLGLDKSKRVNHTNILESFQWKLQKASLLQTN